MIRVAFVRGKYLNNFEGQNYCFQGSNIKLTAISSLFPLHEKFPFPVIRLPCLTDLEHFKVPSKLIKVIANRTLGDSQILIGLEKLSNKFDIFHTADPHYYYSYQLAKMRVKGLIKRLIVTSWETIPFNNETVYRKKYIKKFTQKSADLFICYTEEAKRCLTKEDVDVNKVKVVRLGVDLNRFKSKKIRSKKAITILFVGRLVEEKGITDLKKAFATVRRTYSNVELKIVSDVSYEKMSTIYQSADMLVVPSKTTRTWEEQYGMVLVEAMASGLPIIAYNSGAIHEVLGNAGILVDEGNIEGLSSAITRLATNRNLRIKLGTMGRERAEKYFDSRSTNKKIQKIYEHICGDIDK
jgi:glycosyltransferase involved in cell wall biosynthesis